MIQTAKKMEALQPMLEYAVVVDENGGCWTVLANNLRCRAQLAASCLVRPERNDMVLVSIDQAGRCYMLSILERPDHGNRPTTLSIEGQVNMEVNNGGLRVSAQDGIAFLTPERLSMTSEALEINALKGEASIESFSFLGRFFSGQIEKVKVIADALDAILKRSVQRLGSSYRYVEEHEEIQSASTRMLVDGTLAMQTKNTLHTAEGHIKMDAEQIHLG